MNEPNYGPTATADIPLSNSSLPGPLLEAFTFNIQKYIDQAEHNSPDHLKKADEVAYPFTLPFNPIETRTVPQADPAKHLVLENNLAYNPGLVYETQPGNPRKLPSPVSPTLNFPTFGQPGQFKRPESMNSIEFNEGENYFRPRQVTSVWSHGAGGNNPESKSVKTLESLEKIEEESFVLAHPKPREHTSLLNELMGGTQMTDFLISSSFKFEKDKKSKRNSENKGDFPSGTGSKLQAEQLPQQNPSSYPTQPHGESPKENQEASGVLGNWGIGTQYAQSDNEPWKTSQNHQENTNIYNGYNGYNGYKYSTDSFGYGLPPTSYSYTDYQGSSATAHIPSNEVSHGDGGAIFTGGNFNFTFKPSEVVAVLELIPEEQKQAEMKSQENNHELTFRTNIEKSSGILATPSFNQDNQQKYHFSFPNEIKPVEQTSTRPILEEKAEEFKDAFGGFSLDGFKERQKKLDETNKFIESRLSKMKETSHKSTVLSFLETTLLQMGTNPNLGYSERSFTGNKTEKSLLGVGVGQAAKINNSKDLSPKNEQHLRPEYVEIEYEDGSKYFGEVIDGRRNGLGKMVYASGGRYEGHWADDNMEGEGTLYFEDDQIAYKGFWENSQFEGKGTLYNNSQRKEEHFDCRNFRESLNDNWISYEGQFSADEKKGVGLMSFTSGEQFYGMWKHDYPHGKGTFYDADGNEEVVGDWNDGVLEKAY